MKRFGLVMLAVALCVVAARPAMAQGVRYGVSAGVLLPMGTYNDGDKMGFVGGVGATYWLAGQPIGIRGDLSYSQTSHDEAVSVAGHTKIMGGMASVVYALNPASAPARILLNAGLGFYNVTSTRPASPQPPSRRSASAAASRSPSRWGRAVPASLSARGTPA